MITQRQKRGLLFGSVFLCGIFTGFLLGSRSHPKAVPLVQDRQPSVGTEAFGVLGDEVLTLIFITGEMTITAQRSKSGAPFAVQATFGDGRQPVQRTASPDLEGRLGPLTSLIVKRPVPIHEMQAQFPCLLGTLEIRDSMSTEQMPPMEFRTGADRKALAVSYGGSAFETDLPPTAIRGLESLAMR